MKQLLFVGLLIIQIIVLLLIPFQNELISSYGKEITLLSEDNESRYHYSAHDGPLYLNLEINYLSDTLWQPAEEMKWGTRVYVVITPNDAGIYKATGVTLEKPQVTEPEMVLTGQYQYSDEIAGYHYVEYGFETVANGYELFDVNQKSQWLITVEMAPWGPIVVGTVENHP